MKYTENYEMAHPCASVLQFENGYMANVFYDDSPEDPRTAWDGNPPLAVFSDRKWEGPILQDVWEEIPEEKRDWKSALLILLNYDSSAIDLYRDNRRVYGMDPLCAAGQVFEDMELPHGWRSAEKYAETLGLLCDLAGFAYVSKVVTGSTQRDFARVFSYAPPKWLAESGVRQEHEKQAMEGFIDSFSAWLFGYVYGVASIIRPNGEDVPDSSCWGFYGDDHEVSGLVNFCEEAIRGDLAFLEKEQEESHAMACRDIQTV